MSESGSWLERPATRWVVISSIIALFAITNLPWTLDDYDQAKQAYSSFEMIRQGEWLYGRTPNEYVATKPPLVGWISAALFEVTRSWEIAWRLPSFIAALALLVVLVRRAVAAYGALPGLIAFAAVGLNLLSPHLATLVRTDMPLALVIFLLGAQIWEKIRSGEAWSRTDRWKTFLFLSAAMLIKGPIVYAFILPGLTVYQFLRRKSHAPSAWGGWWPWVFSLLVFLAWVLGGILGQKGFYQEVVVHEFAGRFTETLHKPQPFYFYLPHLLHKFAPWSLLLVGLAIFFWRRRDRLSLQMRPETVWLVCWSLGGLVLMSIIPSKRVDRIFPVIPPLSLLLGAQVARICEEPRWRNPVQPWLGPVLGFALVFTAAYAGWKVVPSYREDDAALVRFGREVREEAAQKHWRYGVIGGPEEGMLLYLRRDHFLQPKAAIDQWKTGKLDALVVRNETGRRWLDLLPGAQLRATSGKAGQLPRYFLFLRGPSKPGPADS